MQLKVFRADSCARKINQRGQVMVLFALLVPALIFCLGVGLDLGWYYLNVSRLQNAADAAAVAGAQTIIADTENFSNYNKVKLVSQYPVDNVYTVSAERQTTVNNGNDVAAEYALKNLSDDDGATLTDDGGDYIITSDRSSGGNSTITVEPKLYEDGDNLYYVVSVSEKIHHFFVGFLNDMDAPVVAVAMLTKNSSTDVADPDPVKIIFDANGGTFSDGTTTDSITIKAAAAMADDETTDKITAAKGTPTQKVSIGKKEFKGWSTMKDQSTGQIIQFTADGKQLTKTEVAALFGDNDTVTLYAVWEDVLPTNNRTLWEQMQYLIAKNVYDPDWDVSVQKYGKVGQTAKIVHNSFDTINNTYISSSHYYTELINLETSVTNSSNVGKEIRYFIDFRRNDYVWTYLTSPRYYYGEDVSNFRVHSLFNVNKAYDVRSGYNDDPLYIRIEAEPGNDYTSKDTNYGTYAKNFTPVRQIVININANNLADSKRPLFFFYDGPDKVKSKNAEPCPVILNLNADFKGVLYMPDVPVVINGNGHTFEGFIVASEYRYLDTSRGSKVKYSSNGKTVTNASDNKIRVNTSNGNVYSILAEGDDAIEMFDNNSGSNRFNLSDSSQFRKFTVETGVKFMYVFYDNNLEMDPSPFYLNTGDLIPLYKLDANGKQVRVTRWEDVNLYDSDKFSTRNLIPKTITGNNNIRTVRLDSNGNPSPLYDEAGNPVYFCDDYVNLTGTYTVLTLDRVADGMRDPKEFLLTKTDDFNVSNTDDWK